MNKMVDILDIMASYMIGKGITLTEDEGIYIFPFSELESKFQLPDGIFDLLPDLGEELVSDIMTCRLVESATVWRNKHIIDLVFKDIKL
jgi:hypothetical protein